MRDFLIYNEAVNIFLNFYFRQRIVSYSIFDKIFPIFD
jgi:hypothetical protein